MQTLHQQQHGQDDDVARSPDHPMMRGVMADQTTAYADEVRVLRQRVALLEAELAATKASRGAAARATPQPPPLTSIDFAVATKPEPTSVFTAPVAPAVAAALPAAPARQAASADAVAVLPEPVVPVPGEPTKTEAIQIEAASAAQIPTEPVPAPPESDPAFAKAWTSTDNDPSFEERVAERAFFQASTVDEESRSWLLDE